MPLESRQSPRHHKNTQREQKRVKTAQSFRLEDHIFYLFGQTFFYRDVLLNKELRRFGVDYRKWRVLAVLNQHPGCSMQHLANEAAVDRTSLNYTVRNMIEQNLVLREERPSDRRSVKLALTPQGHRLLQQILPHVIELNTRCLSGFGKKEVDTITAQLRRMIDNIRE